MTTVFLAGSMNIKHLDAKVKERIANIVASNFDIVVGDAHGSDAAIQRYLVDAGSMRTKIYCSGQLPRNNLGSWPIETVATEHQEGSRAFFTAKDLQMARVADIGLMVWDARSTGTLNNVIELLSQNKKAVVFINKSKSFKNIINVQQLEELVECMSSAAKQKAEAKLRLTERICLLKCQQPSLFT